MKNRKRNGEAELRFHLSVSASPSLSTGETERHSSAQTDGPTNIKTQVLSMKFCTGFDLEAELQPDDESLEALVLIKAWM